MILILCSQNGHDQVSYWCHNISWYDVHTNAFFRHSPFCHRANKVVLPGSDVVSPPLVQKNLIASPALIRLPLTVATPPICSRQNSPLNCRSHQSYFMLLKCVMRSKITQARAAQPSRSVSQPEHKKTVFVTVPVGERARRSGRVFEVGCCSSRSRSASSTASLWQACHCSNGWG